SSQPAAVPTAAAHGRYPLERRTHPVAVVLAHEDYGQLPDRRHVECLVEGPDVHRRFAEEADAHLVAAAVLDGEGETGRQREVAAHDAVAAHATLLCIEQVHPAA